MAATAVENFERLWKSGRPPSIESLLEECLEEDRERLIKELVVAEVRLRIAAGQHPRPSEYLDRFPLYAAALKDDLERECDSIHASLQSTITKAHVLGDNGSGSGGNIVTPGGTWIDRPSIAGRYRLNDLLGKGGFGEVWKAFDPELNRSVAVKLTRSDRPLNEAEMAELLSEGRKLAQLRHPGIIQVYDAGREQGQVFLVSEYVAGGTLADRIRLSHVKPDEAALMLAEIAEALHHAHLRDLVHRDLKPSNILLDAEGRPRIADFGLAVSEREQLGELSSTLGTYAYMSPEQLRGESNRVDARSDIYSLGVILYELLTDRLPYLARTHEQWQQQVREREPRPPRTIDDRIPEALEKVCLKCLAKSMDQRYTTALDLARDLRAAVGVLKPTPARSSAWSIALWATAGVLLAVFAAILWAEFGGQQQENPPQPAPQGFANVPEKKPPEERPAQPSETAPVIDISTLPAGDKWHELLQTPPRIAMWPANVQDSEYVFDAQKKQLRLTCQLEGMFSLGRAEGDFDLQVTVIQPGFDGGFGIYWGLRPDPEHGPTSKRYQSVGMFPLVDRSTRTMHLMHDLKSHPERGNYYVQERVALVTSELQRNEQVLQISVRNGRLAGAQWGAVKAPPADQKTLDFGMPNLKADDSRGEFGVFIRDGAATFRSAFVRRP